MGNRPALPIRPIRPIAPARTTVRVTHVRPLATNVRTPPAAVEEPEIGNLREGFSPLSLEFGTRGRGDSPVVPSSILPVGRRVPQFRPKTQIRIGRPRVRPAIKIQDPVKSEEELEPDQLLLEEEILDDVEEEAEDLEDEEEFLEDEEDEEEFLEDEEEDS